MNSRNAQSTKLAPPGAGLPFAERLFTRWVVGPVFSKYLPLSGARKDYERHTATLISVVSAASLEERLRPVLIPRIVGLEDSSRNWSLQGVLEHLLTVARGIERVMLSLGREIAPPGAADPAKVKPQNFEHDYLDEFKEFAPGLLERMDRLVLSGELKLDSDATFLHPWFGNLNARQWYWFLARHQRIHTRQAIAIVALGYGKDKVR